MLLLKLILQLLVFGLNLSAAAPEHVHAATHAGCAPQQQVNLVLLIKQ
jgi:hypothetical protein